MPAGYLVQSIPWPGMAVFALNFKTPEKSHAIITQGLLLDISKYPEAFFVVGFKSQGAVEPLRRRHTLF